MSAFCCLRFNLNLRIYQHVNVSLFITITCYRCAHSNWTDIFPYDFRDERLVQQLKEMTQKMIAIDPELRKDVGILMHNLYSKVRSCLLYSWCRRRKAVKAKSSNNYVVSLLYFHKTFSYSKFHLTCLAMFNETEKLIIAFTLFLSDLLLLYEENHNLFEK